MALQKPEIPEILTDKNWQKQKGLIAKAHGETGIGALMKKLAAAFNNVNWSLLDPYTLNPAERSPEKLRQRGDQADKEFRANVLKIREASLTLSRQARALAAEWKKSSTIPASVRKHVENIDESALNYATRIRDFTEWQKDFEELLDQAGRKQALARNMLKDWITKIAQGIAAVKKSPDMATYEAMLHQKVRGLATALNSIPELKSPWGAEATKRSVDAFRAKAKTDKDFIALINDIESFVKKLIPALK